eukprot:145922-Rhodomonas_salina.4
MLGLGSGSECFWVEGRVPKGCAMTEQEGGFADDGHRLGGRDQGSVQSLRSGRFKVQGSGFRV